MPSSVIDITLNLPPGDEVVTIPAHQVEAQVDYPHDPTHGSSSFYSTTIPAFLVEPPSTALQGVIFPAGARGFPVSQFPGN